MLILLKRVYFGAVARKALAFPQKFPKVIHRGGCDKGYSLKNKILADVAQIQPENIVLALVAHDRLCYKIETRRG